MCGAALSILSFLFSLSSQHLPTRSERPGQICENVCAYTETQALKSRKRGNREACLCLVCHSCEANDDPFSRGRPFVSTRAISNDSSSSFRTQPDVTQNISPYPNYFGRCLSRPFLCHLLEQTLSPSSRNPLIQSPLLHPSSFLNSLIHTSLSLLIKRCILPTETRGGGGSCRRPPGDVDEARGEQAGPSPSSVPSRPMNHERRRRRSSAAELLDGMVQASVATIEGGEMRETWNIPRGGKELTFHPPSPGVLKGALQRTLNNTITKQGQRRF